MAETTAEVRRDIEMTRERMSDTLSQLEQKLNLMQIVRDHPWPALAVALGAGVLLSGSRADVKAAAATVGATKGASSRVGELLDDAVSSLVTGVHGAFQGRLEGWVNELKEAIGAPQNANRSRGDGTGPSSGAGSWQSQGAGASGFSAASAGTLGAGDSAQLGRAD
ncbi:MAG TPA: DUF3618 domain-containing protein [Gemmatimonadaceae bacterium]|nr:DUF3618 domain-containing protein [Gemmatimonadaceae bacterium]